MSWRREYSGGGRPPGWLGDAASLNFPSQSRGLGGRPLSYLAAQQGGGHPFHEEHHEDAVPMDHHGRASALNFPSTYRAREGFSRDTGLMEDALAHSLEAESLIPGARPIPAQPPRPASVAGLGLRHGPSPPAPPAGQFNIWTTNSGGGVGGAQRQGGAGSPAVTSSPLRDTPPSAALRELLNRYPSARQNVLNYSRVAGDDIQDRSSRSDSNSVFRPNFEPDQGRFSPNSNQHYKSGRNYELQPGHSDTGRFSPNSNSRAPVNSGRFSPPGRHYEPQPGRLETGNSDSSGRFSPNSTQTTNSIYQKQPQNAGYRQSTSRFESGNPQDLPTFFQKTLNSGLFEPEARTAVAAPHFFEKSLQTGLFGPQNLSQEPYSTRQVYQNVPYNSGTQVPTGTLQFRPTTDERGFPTVELTGPRRTTSLPVDEFGDELRRFNQLSNSYHEFSEKPHWREERGFHTLPRNFEEPKYHPGVTYRETVTTERSNGAGPTIRETRTVADYGSGPQTTVVKTTVPGRQPGSHTQNGFATQQARPGQPQNFSLDAFVDEVLGDDMNRSTNQWRNNFAQVQEKFRGAEESSPSPSFPYVNGQNATLAKSPSHHEVQQHSGIVPRDQNDTPEFRKSPQITQYWENTLRSTTPNQNGRMSAAERLQMLHEDPNDPPRIPQRMGSSEALAARKLQFQREMERTQSPQPYKFQPIRIHTNGGPNFATLDSKTAGVARFPLEEFTLSPPRPRPKIHSPSPDQLSESSSVYQMPSGLPHPKPKHNIKEQIYYAGLQQNTLPRSGLRTSPNFPAPSVGSVTSRITEFEGRPGTPTLQLGGAAFQNAQEREPGPLSPRTTVFRNNQPVINMEMGNSGRSTPIPTMFEFAQPEIRMEHRQHQPQLPQQHQQFHQQHQQQQQQHQPEVQRQQPTTTPHIITQATSNTAIAGNVPGRLQFGQNHVGQKSTGPTASPAIQPARNEPQKREGAAQPLPNGKPANDPMTSSIYEPADSKVLTPRGLRKQQQQQPGAARVPVPKFHFPQGKPVSQHENDVAMRKALDVFRKLPGQKASVNEFETVIKAVGLPLYWKRPIYDAITNKKNVDVTQTEFCIWWRNMTSVANDEAARFIYALSGGKKDYLEREDFQSLCYDVIYTHPGLAFYHSATEFHPSYVDVVTTRIFWSANRSWTGRITAQELRKNDLLAQLRFLEKEDDINKETKYFSYEHFYVIYCKFWELDDDHDMLISKRDMLAHDEGALTPLVVNRMFSKAVVRGSRNEHLVEFIGLPEFAAFLMADEDKKNPTSVEYWFRICDLDGDGLVTLYEMEEMYGQVRDKLTLNKIDTMQFGDVACNLLDMIRPKNPNGFTLSDLKKCPLTYRFFNSFTNWRKFFSQEINEGEKPVVRNDEGRELTEWERYCAEEYESLMEAEGDDQIDETHSVNLDEEDARNSFKDLL